MDLYKWAFKFAPFIPSELIADCFALARDIREIDMRASPYDFAPLGFSPSALKHRKAGPNMKPTNVISPPAANLYERG